MATPPKPHKPPVPQFDEQLVNLYEERYLPHADTIYRFAFALTLSLDAAYACVKSTFQTVASKFPTVKVTPETGVLPLLISTCWRVCQDGGYTHTSAGTSAVSAALKSLGIEARASLAAVDVVGLSPADTAKIFTWNEVDVRRHLAEARRTLVRQNATF